MGDKESRPAVVAFIGKVTASQGKKNFQHKEAQRARKREEEAHTPHFRGLTPKNLVRSLVIWYSLALIRPQPFFTVSHSHLLAWHPPKATSRDIVVVFLIEVSLPHIGLPNEKSI